MDKNWFTLRYAPLRPYLSRFVQKARRFFWDWLPDVLVIAVSVWLMLQLWELCFWN